MECEGAEGGGRVKGRVKGTRRRGSGWWSGGGRGLRGGGHGFASDGCVEWNNRTRGRRLGEMIGGIQQEPGAGSGPTPGRGSLGGRRSW